MPYIEQCTLYHRRSPRKSETITSYIDREIKERWIHAQRQSHVEASMVDITAGKSGRTPTRGLAN